MKQITLLLLISLTLLAAGCTKTVYISEAKDDCVAQGGEFRMSSWIFMGDRRETARKL